ncbi:MAG TPA: hypothetical protein PKW42_10380, partial [bacterium]|nr:hypothetical protein [bacterium]
EEAAVTVKNKRLLRLAVQLVCFTVFVLLLVRTKFPPPGRVPAGLFFQADFYLALMTFLSTGHPAPNWYLALTMGF